MRHVVTAFGITITSAILVAACSSRVSSIDTEKTFSNMGADERRQFCEDQDNYMRNRISGEDLRKIRCAEAAKTIGNGAETTAGGARAACRQMYQACMSTPPQAQPQSSCDQFVTSADRCEATVGEAEKCIEAHVDELDRMASRANDVCDEAGRPAATQARKDTTKMESCTRLMTLCPKVFQAITNVMPATENSRITPTTKVIPRR